MFDTLHDYISNIYVYIYYVVIMGFENTIHLTSSPMVFQRPPGAKKCRSRPGLEGGPGGLRGVHWL